MMLVEGNGIQFMLTHYRKGTAASDDRHDKFKHGLLVNPATNEVSQKDRGAIRVRIGKIFPVVARLREQLFKVVCRS